MILMYTYLCNDGVWRTRCAHHIAKNSPLAPRWYPGDHPGEPVQELVETELVGGKRVTKKTPMFYKEEKEIGCPACRVNG